MKNLKYILVGVVVIVLVVIAAKNWGNVPADTDDVADDANVVNICYVMNTEAGENASLRFATTDGLSVTGSFNYYPAEKDKKTGTFVGTVGEIDQASQTQMVDLKWTASGEGVTNVEQLFVKIGETTAMPGFGEMKATATDGVYMYADPAKVSYDLVLQQTDCTDPALK